LRNANRSLAVAGAGIIWMALLGPVIALMTHLSWSSITSSLGAPGAFDPLILSVESGAVTLGVLVLLGTPLAWALARGTLPFPRVWEAGVLATLLLPPLVIGDEPLHEGLEVLGAAIGHAQEAAAPQKAR